MMSKLADIFKFSSGRKAKRSRRPARLGHPLTSLQVGYQVGLVINESSIELSLVRSLCHRRSLIKTTHLDLSNEAATDWDIKLTDICSHLKTFLVGYRIGSIPINIGLSGDDILQRRVYLPQMSPKELAQAALWEGEKLFPFKFDDCYVGQDIVDEVTIDNIIQVGINLTATNRAIVDLIYERFSFNNFKVGQIGLLPDITATVPVEEMFDLAPDHYLILQIDPDSSYAAFVNGQCLEFFQQFITLPILDTNGEVSNLSMISSELISFLDMFSGMGHGSFPKAIILIGQYAQQPEVKTHFGKGTICHTLSNTNCFPGINGTYAPDILSRFLPVIQTALLVPGEKPLAPPSIRKRHQKQALIYRLSIAVMIGVLIASGIQTVDYLKIKRDRAKLLSLNKQVAIFEKSPAYQEYMNLLANLNRGKAFLKNEAERNQSRFHCVLKELSLTIPDDMFLTSLAFDSDSSGYHLQIGGNVNLRDFSPEIVLARYIERLDHSPMFRNVRVINHHKTKKSSRFDLSFQLRMDAGV